MSRTDILCNRALIGSTGISVELKPRAAHIIKGKSHVQSISDFGLAGCAAGHRPQAGQSPVNPSPGCAAACMSIMDTYPSAHNTAGQMTDCMLGALTVTA